MATAPDQPITTNRERHAIPTRHWCFFALLSGSLLTTLFNLALSHRFIQVSPDGVSYIHSAENLLAGRGLKHIAWDCSADNLVPLTMWPPGYPIAIAALSAITGLTPTAAALVIARVCWALIPLGSVLVFSRLGRPGIGLVAGVLVMLSPGALFAPMALADAPFLLLAMISLTCWGLALTASQRGQRAIAWAIASGVAAGCAYAFRNVGLALLVSLPIGAAASVILGGCARPLVRNGAWLVAAMLAGALPFVAALKARTLLLFGSLEAYHMPPSTVGLSQNIRDGIGAMARNLTAAGEPIQKLTTGNTAVFLLITLPLVLLAGALFARMAWRARANPAQSGMLLTLGVYVGAGMALVIAGRTLYEWGESVNPRYIFQYSWIVMGLALIAAAHLVDTRPQYKAPAISAAALLLLPLLALHARPWLLPPPSNARTLRVLADSDLRELLATHAGSHLILSDQNWLLNQMGERCVFNIPISPRSPSAYLDQLPPQRRIHPAMLIIVKGMTPDWERIVADLSRAPRFQLVRETETSMAFSVAPPQEP